MRGKRDSRDYIQDILQYAEKAERILSEIDFEEFAENEEIIDALLKEGNKF